MTTADGAECPCRGLAGGDGHAYCGVWLEDTEFWRGEGWGRDCPEHGVHPHPNPPP